MKKGFTLIEILTVLVIMGLIITLVVPNVLKTSNSQKKKMYENKVEMIEKAAELYGNDNIELKNFEVKIIKVQDLMDLNYLKKEEKDCSVGNCIKSPMDNSGMDNGNICVCNVNNRITASYIGDKDSCDNTKCDNGNIKKPTYRIKFDSQGGSPCEPQYADKGNPWGTLCRPNRIGYDFKGWYEGKNGSGNKIDSTSIAMGDTQVYANWEVALHTLTYNSQGGSSCSPKQQRNGSTWGALCEPTKTGYTFKGWYNGSDKIESTTRVTGDITVNAKWDPNYYFLDLNGYLDGVGSGNISGFGKVDVYVNGSKVATGVNDFYQQYAYGSTYQISNIQTLAGRVYNGVYSGSLSGTIGAGNVNVSLNFSTKSIPIYAETPDGHGTKSPYSTSVKYGSSGQFTISPYSGYYLSSISCDEGVYTSGFYTGSSYTYSQTGYIYNNYTGTSSYRDCRFYFSQTGVTLTYNSEGGSSCSSKTVNPGQQWGTLCVPTKTGYLFGGWYTSTNGNGSRIKSTTYAYDNTTVYAKWNKKRYKLVYHLCEKVNPNCRTKTYEYGDTVGSVCTDVTGSITKWYVWGLPSPTLQAGATVSNYQMNRNGEVHVWGWCNNTTYNTSCCSANSSYLVDYYGITTPVDDTELYDENNDIIESSDDIIIDDSDDIIIDDSDDIIIDDSDDIIISDDIWP